MIRFVACGVTACAAILGGLALSVVWHVASAVVRYDPARPPVE